MFQLKTKLLFLSVFLFFNIVHGQKVRSFNQVEGCSILLTNMTLEQARAKAIVNLKLEAFQKAGIREEITSNSYYEVKKTNTQNKDKYYESNFSEMKGEITFFEVIDFSQKIGENNEILICAKGKVEVAAFDNKKQNKANITVTGLETSYKNNSPLSFNLKGSKPHFYWVFLIDKDENYYLLYPRSSVQTHVLPSSKPLLLPDPYEEDWILETNISEEKNSIIIVTAKEVGIEAKDISDFNKWSAWYKSLPFNSRKKHLFNFLIYS